MASKTELVKQLARIERAKAGLAKARLQIKVGVYPKVWDGRAESRRGRKIPEQSKNKSNKVKIVLDT